MAERRPQLTGSGRLVNVGASMGRYVAFVPLQREGIGTVSFEAKAANDIHLCFHTLDTSCIGQDGRDDSPCYEMTIGGWLNSRTVFHKRGQKVAQVTKSENIEASITSRDFTKYWVTYERGRIELGKGEPGQDPVIRWKDKTPIDGIKYVGFGSWHTPVSLKNVKTSTSIVSEQLLAKKYDPSRNINWFNNESLSDCILSVGNSSFFGHQAVLHCVSPTLASLLSEVPSGYQANKPVFSLPAELRAGIFLQVLKFIYSGRVVVDQIDPAELTKWSSYFRIQPLISLCTLYNSNPSMYNQLELKLNYKPSTSSLNVFPSSSGALRRSHGASTLGSRIFVDFSTLLHSGQYSDITFVISDPEDESPTPMEIKGHQIVAAMQSEPFYLMFVNPMKESSERRAVIREPAQIFRLLLDFLYTGRLADRLMSEESSVEDDLIPLLILAHRYGVFPLRSALCEILEERMNVENACVILSVASLYGLNSLKGAVLELVEKSFGEIIQTAGFLELDSATLMDIAFDDNLKVESEKVVFDALMRWGSAESDLDRDLRSSAALRRRNELRQLLSYVRYPLLEHEYLQQILDENAEIFDTPYLKELVESVLRGGGSSASDNTGDQIVVTHRKSEHLRELFFSQPGDENGIVFWLATAGRKHNFLNPHRSGKVKVQCSSPPSRYTRPDVLVGRTYVTNNQTSGDALRPAWWQVDLGVETKFICNHYSIHIDGSGSIIEDWKLQGSSDGANWVDLSTHVKERQSWKNATIVAWPVRVDLRQAQGYRYFRVIVHGTSAATSHKLCLCGLELYGYLDEMPNK